MTNKFISSPQEFTFVWACGEVLVQFNVMCMYVHTYVLYASVFAMAPLVHFFNSAK